MTTESQPRKEDAATQQIAREAELELRGLANEKFTTTADWHKAREAIILSSIERAREEWLTEQEGHLATGAVAPAQPQPSKAGQQYIEGFKHGWLRACVFYVDIDAEFPEHDCSKQLEIRLKELAQPSKARKEQAPRAQGSPASGERSEQQIGSASNRKWGKSECFVCGQLISTCGLGYVAHMRKHVRQGKLEEVWGADGKHREFNWIGIWKP